MEDASHFGGQLETVTSDLHVLSTHSITSFIKSDIHLNLKIS